MKRSTIAAVCIIVSGVSACATQGPGWTHGQPLSDGSGAAVYDCRPLDGAVATKALKKAHAVLEADFYDKLREREALTAKMSKAGAMTNAEIIAFNNETYALKNEVKEATTALGCTFKGLLAGGSVAR